MLARENRFVGRWVCGWVGVAGRRGTRWEVTR